MIRLARYKDYSKIREFLLESRLSYPHIGDWWDTKVLPGVSQGRRTVLVVDIKDSIEGIFIGKPGGTLKVCTLRLHKSIRSQGVGKNLLLKGLNSLVDRGTRSAKVTISESAEEGCVSFFKSAGFYLTGAVHNRYRKGLVEFIYSCDKDSLIKLLKDSGDGHDGRV